MPENDLRILHWLLTTNPGTVPGKFNSVVVWKRHNKEHLAPWSEPVDMAIAGGFLSNCPAYAFAVGYWTALHRLLPDLPKDPVPALCISKEKGVHPAHINCRLEKEGDAWSLSGTKYFVTCGQEADLMLVAASTGKSTDGKNQLRLVRVNKTQGGIKVKPLDKPLTILPEISHGQVEFSSVRVTRADILPDDGHIRYIKPFRTIEDLHVMAAISCYQMRIGQCFDWPRPVKEQLIALLATLRSIAGADYTAPETHIATAGATAAMQSFLESSAPCWEQVAPPLRSAWQRDKAILSIAAEARAKRLAAAWQRFT